jgi:hypothetical protein
MIAEELEVAREKANEKNRKRYALQKAREAELAAAKKGR